MMASRAVPLARPIAAVLRLGPAQWVNDAAGKREAWARPAG